MKYCAMLNAEDICTGISQVKSDAEVMNGVVIDTYDISVLGKRYVDGIWEEVPIEESDVDEENPEEVEEPIEPEVPVDPQPTQLDAIFETQIMIMEAMAEQYEASLERELINMEVQATIYEAILEMGGAK